MVQGTIRIQDGDNTKEINITGAIGEAQEGKKYPIVMMKDGSFVKVAGTDYSVEDIIGFCFKIRGEEEFKLGTFDEKCVDEEGKKYLRKTIDARVSSERNESFTGADWFLSSVIAKLQPRSEATVE